MDRRRALTVLGTAVVTTAGAAVVASNTTLASGSAGTASAEAVGMLYDTTKCIGCKACVSACAQANGLEPDTERADGLYQAPLTLNSKTKNIIKLYRTGGEQSFMKAQCMHCIDPACVGACMMHALKKDEKGIVYWTGESCVGCRYCQVACPYGVPKFEWTSYNPKIVKCEMCRHRFADGKGPACCEVCPAGAVVYGKREELLAEAHRRLKASPERYVQKVYGEHDGGGTNVLYLAHVDFEKLGLPNLGVRPVPETVRNVQGTVYYGFAAPVALYGLLSLIIRRNQRKQEKEEADTLAAREE
jgi:Fe-S-cluster-containing dehydrogenase component